MPAPQNITPLQPPPDGFSVFESPLGPVAVAFNSLGISAVDLCGDDFPARFAKRFQRSVMEADPPREWVGLIRQALEVGQPLALPIDFDSVTSFQKQVLIHTAAIPRGQTRSYGWLANRVGRPQAARAIGQSMAANPVPLIIPCHRVIRSDGKIGHYGLGGVDNKKKLLQWERAIE